MLWQCALTTTVRVRVSPTRDQLLQISMRANEVYYSLDEAMSDSFATWASKALALADSAAKGRTAQQSADMLKEMGVSFRGVKANKPMMLAAMAMQGILTAESRKDLDLLDSTFGKGVLGQKYSKLHTMARMVNNVATSSERVDVFSFMVRMIWLTLKLKLTSVEFFTAEVLGKNAHTGEAGWAHMTAAKRCAIRHFLTLVSVVPALADKKDLLVEKFGDPVRYADAFPKHDPEDEENSCTTLAVREENGEEKQQKRKYIKHKEESGEENTEK